MKYRIVCMCCWATGFVSATAMAADDEFQVQVVPAVTDVYVLPDSQPAVETTPPAIEMILTPGEYEPASFVIYADTRLPDLRVTVEQVVNQEGESLAGAEVDVRIVKRWIQRTGGSNSSVTDKRVRYLAPELLVYDDALVVVEAGKNMLKMATGEYWDISVPNGSKNKLSVDRPRPEEFPVRDAASLQPLTIDAGSNRQFWVTIYVPEGTQAGIYSAAIKIGRDDKTAFTLPLRFEVLPFALDPSLLHHSIYYRGQLNKKQPEGSISDWYKSRSQMLADLENLNGHGITNPTVYQKIETGLLEDALQLRAEAGMDVQRLYYLGGSAVAQDGQPRKGLEQDTNSALKTAKKFGIDEVYFYGRDEAKGEELMAQLRASDLVRKLGGKMMAAGRQSVPKNPGNFEMTGGAEDLFVSLGALNPRESARWHSKGRMIYSYQNPTGGRELPETWRRNYGLLLWQYDYDGGMPYAWQHSYGNGWNDFDHWQYKDHNFTYPSLDGPIDTIQWEGMREGVDDVRYLSTLLNVLESADPDNLVAAEAREWIASLKGAALGQQDLNAVRTGIIDRILALKQLPARQLATYAPAGTMADPLLPDTPPAGASRRLQLSAVPAADGDMAHLDVAMASAYRASIAVDWDRSLLGWWRFSEGEDSVADLSAWGNDAALKGNAHSAPGWFGYGVLLDGDGAFINAPDIEIAENGTATLEGWFRFRSFAMDNLANMGLFSGIYQNAFTNGLYFSGTTANFEVSALLRLNTWHHIAISWDGDSSTAIAYIDGRPVLPTLQGQVKNVSAIDGLNIGRRGGYLGGLVGTATGTFDGDVDEVRVWSRVLSHDEVLASYNANKSRLRFVAPEGAGAKAQGVVIGANAANSQVTP